MTASDTNIIPTLILVVTVVLSGFNLFYPWPLSLLIIAIGGIAAFCVSRLIDND